MVALTDMVNYTVDDGVAVLTVNNPPVNALGHGVRLGLLKGVEKAQDDGRSCQRHSDLLRRQYFYRRRRYHGVCYRP
jgi:hypothetical protein